MDDQFTNEHQSLRKFKIVGELEVSVYTDHEQKSIVSVYGDPEGLRSLAAVLSTLADLNQQRVPLCNLPVGEGFHLSLASQRGLSDSSLQIDLGRLDSRDC